MTTATAISKEAAETLPAKVASMTEAQRFARIEELAAADMSADESLEFVKLVFGPDAELTD